MIIFATMASWYNEICNLNNGQSGISLSLSLKIGKYSAPYCDGLHKRVDVRG
jgi:hypothetical protein